MKPFILVKFTLFYTNWGAFFILNSQNHTWISNLRDSHLILK